MTYRSRVRVMLAVAIAVAIAGCDATTTERSGPYDPGNRRCAGRVALMMALTGPAAHHVAPTVRGARLAHARWSEQHPECSIGLVEHDTRGDPVRAQLAARRIVADKTVLGVVGGAFSGETRRTKAAFDAGGVTMISPSATAVDLTHRTDVVHRLAAHDGVQGVAIGRYLRDVVQARRVHVVDDGTDYARTVAWPVMETIDPACCLDRRSVVDPGDDFGGVVADIAGSGADAVAYIGSAVDAARLVTQLRTAGITIPVVGADHLYSPTFAAAGGAATEGATVVCPCQPATELDGRFVAAYRDAYQALPRGFAAEGYDAAMIFFQAILALRRPDRARVGRFVAAYDRDGVSGRIRFTARGERDPDTARVWAYRVLGGRLAPAQEIPLRP